MPAQSRAPQNTPSVAPAPAQDTQRSPGGKSNSDMMERLRSATSSVVQGAQTAGKVGAYAAGTLTGLGGGDIRREGTLTDPKGRGAVPLDRAMSEAKEKGLTFGEWVMERYAFQPSTPAPKDNTLRFFSPGLRTPEPEASNRTAYYADKLGQPMIHLHNGTNYDPSVPGSENVDYLAAIATRNTNRTTPLISSMVTLLKGALTGAEPQDVHAILYSDSTIAGTKAIAIVRQQMIAARASKGQAAAEAEVDALLKKHLFVELHGNVVGDLPKGPKYIAWADKKDDMTHKPLPWGGELGLSGKQQDSDADALYMDYSGQFGGSDAHNLQAVGVHAVRQTLWSNNVSSSKELYDKAKSGATVKPAENITGDPGKLWNPRNDPNWGKKK